MTVAASAVDLARFGIAETPLIALDAVAPPGVRLYAKCEWQLPTGSVKDRVAASMVALAQDEGRIAHGTRLLEPSSGNTGIALARIAALTGTPLTVMVPDNVSRERIELLSAFGAHIEMTPGAEGSNGAVRRAEARAAGTGELMLHQYENPANPAAHEATTGPEVIRQVAAAGHDRVDAFVASLGTGGTLMGVGRALRRVWPDVTVVAAEPPAGESIAGLRTLADGYIPPVFDPSGIDRKLLVRSRDSIVMTRRLLAEQGLFVGPSSGAAVHAAVKVASRLSPGSVVVTVLPDAGWKYLSTGIFGGSIDEAEARVIDATLW
jgi:cysteine synthase